MPNGSVLNEVLPQVRHNCLVSDAVYWGYYSTCGLLLRLREQYRFEAGLSPDDPVDNKAIGAWIEKRETRWQELDSAEPQEITIKGKGTANCLTQSQ